MLDAPSRVGLPIDPRIQARLVEVRRHGGRRRRRLAVSAAGLTLLAVLAWGAGRSPLLAVHQVDLRGAGPTSREMVVAAAGLDRHHQMLDLSPDRMRDRLEALPWVGRAVVRRRWPTTVEIVLTSRVAVAQLPAADGQPAVVDAQGRVLALGQEAATVLKRPGAHLPRLTGVGAAGPAGTTLAPASRVALSLVTAVPTAIPLVSPSGGGTSVEAVTTTTGGILNALLSSGITVVFGSPEQLGAKLVAMRTVLERVTLAGVTVIDVRVPDTPVLTRGNH